MPHLSIETYVTQYFWLVFFLLGFYYMCVTQILPKIGEGIKARRKILELGTTDAESEDTSTDSPSTSLILTALSAPKPKTVINISNYRDIYSKSNLDFISKFKN